MAEVQWLPGIVALIGGLGAGVLLALVSFRNSRGSDASSSAAHSNPERNRDLEDLQEQKTEVLRALRNLQDQRGHAPLSGTQEEVRDLEVRAARILQQIDSIQSDGAGAESDAPIQAEVRQSGSKPAPPANTTFAAVKWAAIGAFFPIVAFSLYLSTSERAEGEVMTGAPLGVERPSTFQPDPIPPGQPGAPVQNVPPALQPRPSAAVDRARAAVSSEPESVAAWSELGYALVDAEGWIDAFETSKQILTMAPGHPDGLLIHAIVRIAMGQRDVAQDLVTQALTAEPSHMRGLMYQGMLAMQRGDKDAAHAAWNRGLETAGPGNGFEELLAMPAPMMAARSGATQGAGEHPPHPKAAPPLQGAASSPATATTGASDATIRGTLRLADGAVPPRGGVVFVIARAAGVQGGPPAAVRRLQAKNFPMAFEIGPADAMLGGPFPSEVTLSVRMDADGNATTRGPDDLVAAPTQASAGASGVDLILAPAS
ncbi:MAG TPA: hypothetical protein DIU15_10845 [Deltaproteobacteria bacterium]|nr:hypothetical protein [Deltaproteobacteria bacterium]HCP46534.1 hypothetical protein [Deltaproteobacteria bacterium]